MAKDPAMLWYWGDWYSGTSLLSRFLKGCYMDLLHAQFNNGRLSVEDIKTCLGSDFGTSWPALQKKFKQDESGLFFNERFEQEKNKRKDYSQSRRDNISKRYSKATHEATHVIDMKVDKENENENSISISSTPVLELFEIEKCVEIALKDPRWVQANNTNKTELEDFNKTLEKRGIYETNPGEYKSHFANWKALGKVDKSVTEVSNSNLSREQLKAISSKTTLAI